MLISDLLLDLKWKAHFTVSTIRVKLSFGIALTLIRHYYQSIFWCQKFYTWVKIKWNIIVGKFLLTIWTFFAQMCMSHAESAFIDYDPQKAIEKNLMIRNTLNIVPWRLFHSSCPQRNSNGKKMYSQTRAHNNVTFAFFFFFFLKQDVRYLKYLVCLIIIYSSPT